MTRLRSVFSAWTFAPEKTATPAQWVEIGLISFGAVALSWLATPDDPTLARAHFPWQWLAPVLIALRYGVMPGLLGGVVLIANTWVAMQWGRIPAEFSPTPLFGGGLLVLLCGEFSDVWRDKNKRMEETYLYVTERLSRLTKRHLLLNLSHDRLEQEMLARPGSLRDALARLRTISMAAERQTEALPGGAELLQLLSQYVKLESATLYTLEFRGSGYVLGPAVARLGEPEALAPDDELLRLALEKGSLAHIASQELSLQRQTSQLVVAPLIAGDDELIGVLAVDRMPFFALNIENLQMLLVMLGYYADNLGSAQEVIAVQMQLPSVPVLFAQELVRMIRLGRKVGIPSRVVVMRFTGDRQHQKEIPTEFLRVKRGLDLYWLTYVQDTPVLAILMPFSSVSAKDGFLLRMDTWLASRFHGNFESLKIAVHEVELGTDDALPTLAQVMGGA